MKMRIKLLIVLLIAVISLAFSWIMSAKTWKDFLIGMICAYFGAGVILLTGVMFEWSPVKTLLGIILAAGYSRPVIFGINRQIKQFFNDPKAYIDKFKELK